MTPATIVPTGTANLASVIAAFRRAGAQSRIAASIDDINQAKALVLPGVGSFGPAMAQLRSNNWERILQERIIGGVPVLAICLGMQVLFESSEESPGVNGLAVLPGHFERFPTGIQTPHVGWNMVEPVGEAQILTKGDAYFTHSYRLAELPPNIPGASTTYGSPFISAVEHRNIVACQFHPELSGAWGIDVLRRWIQKGADQC